MLKKIVEKGYLFIILAVLYAPIICVIVFSFSNTNNFTFANGFTFDGYKELFTSSAQTAKLLSAVKNTVIIAVISSVVATFIGAISAVGIFYLKPRSRRIVENVNQLPIINSEIVMAVSLMLFFTTFSFPQGFLRLIIGHISFCTPYVVLSVMPRLMQMDPNVYEAALDLGASPVKALFKVVIPSILPGVLSGFALAFTLSMDDFIITQINKGATTGIDTLSTYLYSSTRSASGLATYWFPVFTIIIVLIVTVVLVINFRSYKKKDVKKGDK